jgi:hypothetical protein
MAKTKGIICFRGSVGGSGKLHLFRSEILGVKSVSPVSNLTTFCSSMAPKTNALIRELTYCISQAYSTADPPADRNMDRIATVFFREEVTGTVRRFSFPLPVDSIVEDRTSGERLTMTAVEDIVAFLATATGLTLFPLYGIVTQKR